LQAKIRLNRHNKRNIGRVANYGALTVVAKQEVVEDGAEFSDDVVAAPRGGKFAIDTDQRNRRFKVPGSEMPMLACLVYNAAHQEHLHILDAGILFAPNYHLFAQIGLGLIGHVVGPMQIDARINQDQTISKDLSLWNQQGSQVLRGQTLVLPIDNSFLYVEPI
jgi:hypothetical protein